MLYRSRSWSWKLLCTKTYQDNKIDKKKKKKATIYVGFPTFAGLWQGVIKHPGSKPATREEITQAITTQPIRKFFDCRVQYHFHHKLLQAYEL